MRWQSGDSPVPGFMLVQPLGEGGFGEVWQAIGNNIPCALKLLKLEGLGYKEYRAVRVMKGLKQSNLVPLHGFWLLDEDGKVLSLSTQGDSSAYNAYGAALVIAMGLGEETLHQRLRHYREKLGQNEIGGIPPDELLRYMHDAARALDFLNLTQHRLGGEPTSLRHGDVKPANMLRVGDGVWLCDFGLVDRLDDVRRTVGKLLFTPAYAAPEILDKPGKPTVTSDQYSLAVSYFELRFGVLPYTYTDNRLAIQTSILLRELNLSPCANKREREVIDNALARDPAKRFVSCRDFVRALEHAVQSSPTPAPAAPVARPKAPPPPPPTLAPRAERGPPPIADALFFPGKLIERHELEKVIGKGGAGKVWLAKAPGGRRVAIKILEDLSQSMSRQEWRALKLMVRLRHPHLLPVTAYYVLDGWGATLDEPQVEERPDEAKYVVIVTELAERNLLEELKRCKAAGMAGVDPGQLLDMMEQAAKALDYLNYDMRRSASAEGAIVHRDIKPENILLDERGDVKVSDMGLAKLIEGDKADLNRTSLGMTPYYAPPELLDNRIHLRTDQYSLAVTYYHLRTGHLPIDTDRSAKSQFMDLAMGKLVLTGLESEVERAVVARATAFHPEERFESSGAFVAALRHALEEPPSYEDLFNLGCTVVGQFRIFGLAEPAAHSPEDVWLAEDADGKRFRLKVLQVRSHAIRKKAIRALEAARRLNHEHVVRLEKVLLLNAWGTSIYEPTDTPARKKAHYVVCISGEPGESISESDRFGTPSQSENAFSNMPEFEFAMKQMADALDYVHKPGRGLVHGNIRPETVYWDGTSVRISALDFADFCERRLFAKETIARGLTTTGGEPCPELSTSFAAPPQNGGDTSPAGDLYSFALVYYWLRTGRMPVDPELSSEEQDRLLRAGLIDFLPPTSPAERDILLRATSRVESIRIVSCRAMVAELADLGREKASRLQAEAAAEAEARHIAEKARREEEEKQRETVEREAIERHNARREEEAKLRAILEEARRRLEEREAAQRKEEEEKRQREAERERDLARERHAAEEAKARRIAEQEAEERRLAEIQAEQQKRERLERELAEANEREAALAAEQAAHQVQHQSTGVGPGVGHSVPADDFGIADVPPSSGDLALPASETDTGTTDGDGDDHAPPHPLSECVIDIETPPAVVPVTQPSPPHSPRPFPKKLLAAVILSATVLVALIVISRIPPTDPELKALRRITGGQDFARWGEAIDLYSKLSARDDIDFEPDKAVALAWFRAGLDRFEQDIDREAVGLNESSKPAKLDDISSDAARYLKRVAETPPEVADAVERKARLPKRLNAARDAVVGQRLNSFAGALRDGASQEAGNIRDELLQWLHGPERLPDFNRDPGTIPDLVALNAVYVSRGGKATASLSSDIVALLEPRPSSPERGPLPRYLYMLLPEYDKVASQASRIKFYRWLVDQWSKSGDGSAPDEEAVQDRLQCARLALKLQLQLLEKGDDWPRIRQCAELLRDFRPPQDYERTDDFRRLAALARLVTVEGELSDPPRSADGRPTISDARLVEIGNEIKQTLTLTGNAPYVSYLTSLLRLHESRNQEVTLGSETPEAKAIMHLNLAFPNGDAEGYMKATSRRRRAAEIYSSAAVAKWKSELAGLTTKALLDTPRPSAQVKAWLKSAETIAGLTDSQAKLAMLLTEVCPETPLPDPATGKTPDSVRRPTLAEIEKWRGLLVAKADLDEMLAIPELKPLEVGLRFHVARVHEWLASCPDNLLRRDDWMAAFDQYVAVREVVTRDHLTPALRDRITPREFVEKVLNHATYIGGELWPTDRGTTSRP